MRTRPIILLALSAALTLPACQVVTNLTTRTGGKATLVGQQAGTALTPAFRAFAYAPGPDHTADIYFTDLTDDQLADFFDPGGSWTGFEGQIVHVHMFLMPKAGSTPIDTTAANIAVRYALFSRGQIGLYTGAGFMLPARKPGNKAFTASIPSASLRLDRATDYFKDLLGPSELSMSFTAPHDAELVAQLKERLDAASRTAEPVARASMEP